MFPASLDPEFQGVFSLSHISRVPSLAPLGGGGRMSRKQLHVTGPQLSLPDTESLSVPLAFGLSLGLRPVGRTRVPCRGPKSRLGNGGGYGRPRGSSAEGRDAAVAAREGRGGAGRKVPRRCWMERRVTMARTSLGSGRHAAAAAWTPEVACARSVRVASLPFIRCFPGTRFWPGAGLRCAPP